ncbi:PALP domain-containing protein [Trichostrongylus colubriformis]|uniref:L-serine ammonia-lyase n=1 Tax=Trichostrongylus colubriformis TaxID=6319 RepID=A0AAN8FXH6_TRICO
MVICAEEVEKARHRFAGRIHRTPVITCESIDKVAGCKVFMKCEHLQKTGSFKARGALNAVQKMKDEGPVKGVVRYLLLHCLYREETCARLAKELNYQVVEPFNNPDVICGQGTIGAEIVEQVPDADAVFLAVGGGGMASGITAYIAEVRPDIKVYLVEPEGKELTAYLTNGEITPERDVVDTVADGIRVLKVGEYCYPILKKSCTDKVITVSDDEIRAALKLIWTRTKQRVEPSAAVPLAGLLKVSPSELGVKKAVLLLCGGNVDLDFVP